MEQAVLLLRYQDLAGRRPWATGTTARTKQGTQSGVDAPLQRGCDLDARQVGVSLVRRLGPGLSLRRVRLHRPGLRQRAVDFAATRMVYAPEWTNPRLRMGLWRCQPARPCLGGLSRLQD